MKGRVHFYKGFTSFSKHLDISEFGYIWNILHEDLQMFLIKKSAKGKRILVFLWCLKMNLCILCNLRDCWRKKKLIEEEILKGKICEFFYFYFKYRYII